MGEAHRVATQRHPDATVRRSIRLVSMLSELHKAGYQRLRAMPHMAPSGLYWRYVIAPVVVFYSNHGALISEPALERIAETNSAEQREAVVARWTSGEKEGYFDWPDAGSDGARELAAKFVGRFRRLASLGEGWDHAYAGWHLRALGLAEHGWLPVVFSDYHSPSLRGITLSDCRPPEWREHDGDVRPHLPLPPPGDLAEEARLNDD